MIAFIRSVCLVFLVCSVFSRQTDGTKYETIIKGAFNEARGIFGITILLWDAIESSGVFNRHSSTDQLKVPFSEPGNKEKVIGELKALSAKTDQLSINMNAKKTESLDKLQMNIPGLQQLNHEMQNVFIKSLTIADTFDNFLDYLQAPRKKFDRGLLIKFAEDAVAGSNCGVDKLLLEIHALLIESNNEINTVNVLSLLNDYGKLFLQYTKAQKSRQQLLQNLLSFIIFTEIKGFLVSRFSFKILDLYKGGSYEGNIEKVERDWGNRLNKTIVAFKSAMKVASRELTKDDPDTPEEDKTYAELKNVFQAFLISERDINPNDRCSGYCNNYPESLNAEYRCIGDDPICMKQKRCQGDLHDCGYNMTNGIYACLSEANSTRRYEYLIDYDRTRYGASGTCKNDLVYATSYWLFPWNCDVCTCTCAEKTNKTERYFNLEPSLAAASENYVVVGAQLVKENHTVHIQVQEGQLLAGGAINATSVRWVPINNQSTRLFTLTWGTAQEINLDDLEAPINEVVVGLAFENKSVDESTGQSRLHLKVITKPINFDEGLVLQGSLKELTGNTSNDEVIVKDRDIPTRTEGKSTDVSSPNQFVKFGTSGLHKDAGQSTVPFIDIQPLTTLPPAPLSGAGLYHKSRPNDSGYLALRLFTYNYEPHLEPNMPANITEAVKIEGVNLSLTD